MRKTLFAMVGLVAVGLWALPALAVPNPGPDLPKVMEPIPLENRSGIWHQRAVGTLSGTVIKQAGVATTTWFMYPGACQNRIDGTWATRSTPQADSLNGYTAGTTGPYGVLDQSLSEILWHVSDNATCTPGTDCPPALNGSRMLWCGKFDANWVVKYGYPNLTYQILYIDTGAGHGATYDLTFKHNFSAEFNYDYIYLVGGGDGIRDPIGNTRSTLDGILATGSNGNQKLLVRWTGCIEAGSSGNTTGGTVPVSGNGSTACTPPPFATSTFTIAGTHRALYLVFQSDCLFSQEDGNWPSGRGQQIDDVSVTDGAVVTALYTDEASVNVADTSVPPGGGTVIMGTASTPTISARVGPGVGTLWQLVAGNNLPTPDTCTPKNKTTDNIFEGGNAATFHTIPNTFNSIVSCSFPVNIGLGPGVGIARVVALWDQYLDLPRNQGYVEYAEYRFYKGGSWSGYSNTHGADFVHTGAAQAWALHGDDLAQATEAESVQVRYNMQCIPFFAFDHQTCGDVLYGILYDNFRLEMVSGVPAPLFTVFVGDVAQSMFVDGTMGGAGSNCLPATVAAGQCWPGVRGSDTPDQDPGPAVAGPVRDNFNSPTGDSLQVSLLTGLRKNGKGINWHFGFDRTVNSGLTIAHTNPNYLASKGAPAWIYRLFDPTSQTWSAFDSSEMDADYVSIQAGDTIVNNNVYRFNWPPRDKAGLALPNGFTINTKGNYNDLAFLPRGTRLQYYFKAVDISGATNPNGSPAGISYQFSSDADAREVEDLPPLPTSGIIAPDIIEFDVLPRIYANGAAGSQLQNSKSTPILDLDGSYTRWNFQTHATVQALRSMGVRFDRFRTLQGLEEGGHIGGHEFINPPCDVTIRAGRLSNYFPNDCEYGILDSLRTWYRIMIESSHTSTQPVNEEVDAQLLRQWWISDTGTNGGDRCIFASGDDYFSALLATGGAPHPNEQLLASDVFGVLAAGNAWNGNTTNSFPVITDLFADPAAGPFLGSGSFQYVIDGGCPAPNRFDALTKVGSAEAQNSATYPTFQTVTQVAAVSYMTERDVLNDHDRNKALGYGFSIQFIRGAGDPNLLGNLGAQRQVLYKFLTSCRGPRAVSDTASCWPCPSNASPIPVNWATASVFQTGTYGPLYAIQDHTKFQYPSGVGETASAPAVNRLHGNFPNPFNPETAIRFTASTNGRVEVRIFDVAGRLVQTLAKNVTQGVNEVRWNGKGSDGSSLASGIYFVKVKYPDGSESLNGLKIAIVR